MIEIDFIPAAANVRCREKGPDCVGAGGYQQAKKKWPEGSHVLRIRGWGAGGTATLCACEKCTPAVLERFKVASKHAKKAAKERKLQ